MKSCRNKDCKETNPQPYDCFVKDKRYADGYQNRCKSCQKRYDSLRFEKKRDQILTASKAYYESNLEKARVKRGEWRIAHREYAVTYGKKYRAENKAKERAKVRRYQLAKYNATPAWLTKDHHRQIEEIYRNCPKGYEVDHIVPIQGKAVRGLHVPWNLQYLKMSENRSKHNKY